MLLIARPGPDRLNVHRRHCLNSFYQDWHVVLAPIVRRKMIEEQLRLPPAAQTNPLLPCHSENDKS